MNLRQFNQIRRDYNRIPLVREVFADLDTPLSTYLKLADEPYTYLFESVQGGEKWGRHSIIGMACNTRIKVFGTRVQVETGDEVVSETSCDDRPVGRRTGCCAPENPGAAYCLLGQ